MKDCSTCPFRASINPEYKRMKFEGTPCATCEPWEPRDGGPMVQPAEWCMLKMHGLDSDKDDENGD